jgi:hypothetical protein
VTGAENPAAGPEQRMAAWAALLAALALLPALAGTLMALLPLAGPDVSRMYNEGWNAFHQLTAGAGGQLYDAPAEWAVANYPPLSFLLIGGAGRLLGLDVVLLGRAASVAAFLASGLLVALILRRASGLWGIGLAAGLGFLVTTAGLMPDWIATNEPHFLGLAFALAGLWVYARSPAPGELSWGQAFLCTLLFAAALAVKQSFIAFALAIAAFELLQFRLPRLVRFAVSGCFWLAALLAAIVLLGGPFWREHLLFDRNWSVGVFLANAQALLTQAGSLVLAATLAALLLLDGRAAAMRFWVVLAAVVLGVTGTLSFGGGVNRNIFAELIAAAAILAGLGLARLAAVLPAGPRSIGILAGLMVLAHVSAGGRGLAQTATPLLGGFGDPRPVARATAEVITRLAAAPGEVLCEDLLACLRAGKPMSFDAYFVHERVLIGRVPEAEVVGMIRDGRFAVIQLGRSQPYLPERGAEARRWRFTPAVLRAIHEHYELSYAEQGFGVFTRRRN